MKLNIWKNQKEIEKTYECKEYDIMFGTVEDFLDVLDEAQTGTEEEITSIVMQRREVFYDLLMDIFPELTREELRRTKIKEIVPLFFALFEYAKGSFASKN